MRGQTGPDFIEALARGLDVLRAFGAESADDEPERSGGGGRARLAQRRAVSCSRSKSWGMSVPRVAAFALTPRVLELGMAYIGSMGMWDIARPHMERLVAHTGESSSLAQLDGSDIVYVARVAVPKIITLAVTIGTRFPALQTSLGKVLLASLPHDELERVLAEPSRSGITPRWNPDAAERDRALCEVQTRGWALTDEQLAPGIRSIAAPGARRREPCRRRAQRERTRRRDQHRDAHRAITFRSCWRPRRRSAPNWTLLRSRPQLTRSSARTA